MRKHTAYLSVVLMVAAVMFVARFGLSRGENKTNAAAIAYAPTASPTPTLVAPTPTTAATATAPLRSPTATPTATPAATPGILSTSGGDRPAGNLETGEVRVPGSPARTLQTTLARQAAEAADNTSGVTLTQDSGTGQIPDRIVAPTIKLDSKIIPVGWKTVANADGSTSDEWTVASYAVSWHKTSAKLDEPGNTVLTGHNNIEGEVFRHLEDFKIGDPITVYSGGRAYRYQVTDKFIVKEKDVPFEQRLNNAKWIGPFPDERITVMSCWPYTGNSHRIFIIAKPAKTG